MRAAISTTERDPAALLQRVLASPGMLGADLARTVTTPEPYTGPPAGRDAGPPPCRRGGPGHQGLDPALPGPARL